MEKSGIPPHTSAHKYGTRKDISVLCNEGEHHEPHYIMVVQGKSSSPHCSHKERISTKKVANKFQIIISYKSLTVRTQSVTDNAMEQSPSWEADRFSASQETPSILWNLKFHYQIYKSPQTVPILIQINAAHASQSHFWSSILIVSFPLCLGLPSGLFPPGLHTKSNMHLSCLPCMPYIQSISFNILLPKYLVSTDHKAHHYLVLFTPLIATESIWSHCYWTMFQPLIVIIGEIHTEKPEEMSHLLQFCHTYK